MARFDRCRSPLFARNRADLGATLGATGNMVLEWPPMFLNDVAIRAAKPGPKPVKLSDERGLFLLMQPSGGKLWRLKYRIAGKEKKLSLGRYPDVALRDAREGGAEARKLIAAGIDPSEKKRVDRLDATLKAATTFKAVAEEYIAKSDREGRAAGTVGKARWLLSLLEPCLGSRPVDEISPAELKKAETRGHLETARRMRSFASRGVPLRRFNRAPPPPTRPPRYAARWWPPRRRIMRRSLTPRASGRCCAQSTAMTANR